MREFRDLFIKYAFYRYVVTNYGFRELYRGIEPVFWRNGMSNALFFMLREEASERLPKRVSCKNLKLNHGMY